MLIWDSPVPANVPLAVPPPWTASTELSCTSTAPLLLNATLCRDPPPFKARNDPLLLNVAAFPSDLQSITPSCKRNVPLLSITASLITHIGQLLCDETVKSPALLMVAPSIIEP